MLIRYFWRDWERRGMKPDSDPVDAFWVEATTDEAEAYVFPLLETVSVRESRRLADEFSTIVEQSSVPLRPFCFLVARDLSSIDPMHAHYPFHHMWNAYSPFEALPTSVIENLQELRTLRVPHKKSPVKD